MAQWKVSTKEKKCVEEREIWTHHEKGVIERRTGFRWGSYIVNTDDQHLPQLELVEVPGGDGVADSVDMNSCGYDTELIGLEDGCYLDIAWSTTLSAGERDELEGIWQEDSYDGWESLGWTLDDTQVWFWGDLEIESLDQINEQPEPIVTLPKSEKDEGLTNWFPAKAKPVRDGYYDIELLAPRAWPFMPINRAKWNGCAWVDDAGEKLKIKCWRGLLKG